MVHARTISRANAKERVLSVFSVITRDDPPWLIDVFEPNAECESSADLMLRLDIGDFPVMLCTSMRELRELIAEPLYTDMLFLLIRPDYSDHRIRDKSIGFFKRERRVKGSHVLTRPLQARR